MVSFAFLDLSWFCMGFLWFTDGLLLLVLLFPENVRLRPYGFLMAFVGSLVVVVLLGFS